MITNRKWVQTRAKRGAVLFSAFLRLLLRVLGKKVTKRWIGNKRTWRSYVMVSDTVWQVIGDPDERPAREDWWEAKCIL